MEILSRYVSHFKEVLAKAKYTKAPTNLYEPIDYILQLGGKRIRPTLVYMGTESYQEDISLSDNAALALEVFHNFTLVHDDIMDDAPLRRGQQTVHEKYDINTGILSGDVMLIKAYEHLNTYPSALSQQLMTIFNTMAIQVCEGQQMDMDFETQDHVTIPDYMQMIEYKTSVLLAACLQMGAIIGGASEKEAYHLYQYGVNVGIAFQMQDDILDTFGTERVGKQDGGDIIQNKKTYLYLKALELGSDTEKGQLLHWYSQRPSDPTQKIQEVRAIFENNHVVLHAQEVKKEYRDLAFSHLEALSISEEKKDVYKAFAQYLLERDL